MTRKLLVVLVLLTAVLMVGCFDYQEYVVLEKDGSGTLDMRLGMQMSMIEGMMAMAQAFSDEAEPAEEEPFISKENIEKYLAENDAGVKMISYEELEEDGMKVWKIKYSFEDLNSIHYITESLNEDFEAMEEMGEPETASEAEADESDERPELNFTKQKDGTWLFERGMENSEQMSGMEGGMGMGEEDTWEDESAEPQNEGGEESGESEMPGDSSGMDEMAKSMEKLAASMGKFGVSLTVQFPG